jgi:chitin synthase
MKHFPQMKLVFTPDAQCRTNAPDRWSVLLSQRRRWINSTVHNLLELLFLPQLCGFCCFSMRFVVFLDLFSTVVQPAAVLYLLYLVYTLVFEDFTFPLISIILLAAIYGLQVLIFIIKRQWQHIGWMVIYMLAIPVFSFYIPLYAFWHFDDFSWGNTRVVADGKKAKYLADTEPFDPKSIPLKKWTEHEQELWEKQSVASRDSRASDFSDRSGVSHASRYTGVGAPRAYRTGGSVYGGSVYGAPAPVPPAYNSTSRPGSVAYGYGNVGRMTPQANPVAPVMPGYDASGRPLSMTNMTQVTGYSGAFPTGPVNGSVSSGVVSSPAGGMNAGGALPSNEEILREVRHILSTANLMTITKKQVRDELATFFGTDLTSKKEYINQCIDGILQGRL